MKAGLLLDFSFKIAQGIFEVVQEYDWRAFLQSLPKALNYISEGKFEEAKRILLSKQHLTLNHSNLLKEIPKASLIYWEGVGNGTHWILLSFSYAELPLGKAYLVWDNLDYSLRALNYWNEKVTLNFFGFNYSNPRFPGNEIDLKFFGSGKDLGNSLKEAINEMYKEQKFYVFCTPGKN